LINSGKTTVNVAAPAVNEPRVPQERPRDAPTPEPAHEARRQEQTSSLDNIIVDASMKRRDAGASASEPAPEGRPAPAAEAKKDPCSADIHSIRVDRLFLWDGDYAATVNGRKAQKGVRVGRQSIVTGIDGAAVWFECMPSPEDAKTAAYQMHRNRKTTIHGRRFGKQP
jgi:hypothetical protein